MVNNNNLIHIEISIERDIMNLYKFAIFLNIISGPFETDCLCIV